MSWLVNADSIYRQFANIAVFDESIRYYGPSLHIVGANSWRYPFSAYQKIFPNLKEEGVQVVEGAGHMVHMEKPKEVVELIS